MTYPPWTSLSPTDQAQSEPLYIGAEALRGLQYILPRFTPVEKQYDPKAAERARLNRARKKALK